MSRSVNRRIFLRGLGGACVAAPFLGTLGHRSLKAQSAVAPRRLIAMFTHYGCVTSRFFPQKSHGPLTAADLEGTTLKHLAPFVDQLLIPRGIRAMNEWTPNVSRGQGGEPHSHICSLLTCQPFTPNSDEAFSFDTSTLFAPRPVDRSLDHVMAEQLSEGGVPLLVRVGNVNDNFQSAISFSAPQTLYPGLGSPAQLFSLLTGVLDGGSALTPDSYAAARGKSVLDLVMDDLDTLGRFDMSQADKNKLEAWKALLDDTGRALGGLRCNAQTAEAIGATQANIDAIKTSGVNVDAVSTKFTDTLDGADLYSNLIALSAVCNVNPVIVLKFPPFYVLRGLGLELDTHSLSHRLKDASMSGTCVPGALDMLLTIDDFYARKFAYLVQLLRSIDEGEGSVLDNTAAVWLQEMSDGAAHNLNNLPIVQVGSAGGYFRTGCAVNVEDGTSSLSNGNSESACTPETTDAIDGTRLTTGTDPKLANAPINKYYCNLMNALGVKAGPDGFPLLGGTAEVTSFGRYDRTEDFIGGGTAPPFIHSPGEYEALKASS
jgi:hypothetical protein